MRGGDLWLQKRRIMERVRMGCGFRGEGKGGRGKGWFESGISIRAAMLKRRKRKIEKKVRRKCARG